MVASETVPNFESRPKRRKLLWGGLALLLGSGTAAWFISEAIASRGPAEQYRQALEAVQHHDMASLTEAIKSLREYPDYTPHVHLLQGILLLRSNQPMEAMQQLGLAKEHPDTAALSFALAGEVLYKIGNLRGAESVLREAVALDDKQTDAHRWLAATYYDLGAMHDAQRHLATVSELAPTDPRPNRLRGLIYKDYEKYTRAVEEYEETLKRQPNQKDVLFELAFCLAKLRQLDRALEVLRDCEPTAEALTLAAECEYAQDDPEAAQKLLDRAFALEPIPLETFQLQATLALDARDVERAMDVLEQGVKKYPKDFTLRFKLSQAYRRLGREDEAEEQSQLSEELRELRYRFTELHDEAMDNPLDPEIRYQLGVVAQQLDKPELAQSWFRATLALDPAHVLAQEAVGGRR